MMPPTEAFRSARAWLAVLFGPLDGLEEDAVVEGAAVGALCGGGGDYVIPMQTVGLGDGLEDLEDVR